jgi:hypothetical protein
MHIQGENFWGRRRFLRQTMTAAGAGVLVLLSHGEKNSGQARTGVAGAGNEHASRGYRLTDHIRTYYATLRS